MLLTHDKILNLPVYARSGQYLGHIHGFDVEVESQTIHRYRVKSGLAINPFAKELIIGREQIISIGPDKMIVDDAVYTRVAKEDNAAKKRVKFSSEIAATD